MDGFHWTCPTEFYFGEKAEKNLGPWLKKQGYSKLMLTMGSKSARKIGIYDRVIENLKESGIELVATVEGIRPNPEISDVRKGVKLAKELEVDCLIALGGGSVIDCAKAICAGAFYDGDPWDFFKRPDPVKPTAALPLAVVLTIPAAGSEASDATVISNDAEGMKTSTHADFLRPKVAFMDPALSCNLSAWDTGAGVTDICAHIIERYCSAAPDVLVTDTISLGLLKSAVEAGKRLQKDPQDLDARAQIMWISTLAHNDLCGCGREAQDWASHGLEHEVSALFPNVTHGAGLAAIMPIWMLHVAKANPERIAKMGHYVFGLEPSHLPLSDAWATAHFWSRFFRDMGMPKNLSELGVRECDVPKLVRSVLRVKGEPFGSFKPLYKEDVRTIYIKAIHAYSKKF